MDVNALHKDELEFELACRGVSDCETVATMRKILRVMFRREASGESSISIKVPAGCIKEPGKEILICSTKLASLVAFIAEISDSPDIALIRRLRSRLTHLANRAKLIVPSDVADSERHLLLLEDIDEAILSLESVENVEAEDEAAISEQEKAMLHRSLGEEAAQILGSLGIGQASSKVVLKEDKDCLQGGNISAPAVLKSSQILTAMSEKDGNHKELPSGSKGVIRKALNSSQRLQRSSTLDPEFQKRKLVPIKDWGVKFSGRGDVSINAFLERVEELKEARNADEDDLFRYAIDLFEDEALIWFRANRSVVANWSDLVDLLVDTFQAPNYQDELLEEIKRRTQSKQERVVIYLSIMQNMFNRLPAPLSESQKLIILRKNLQPYYQKEICRDTFNSVAELTSVLRIIERTKIRCEVFKEPATDIQSLERDLAYKGPLSATQQGQKEVAAIDNKVTGGSIQSKCWNCRSPGHRFRNCNLPRQRLFCYKCGRFGNTVEKCSCSKTSEGNGQSESKLADSTPRT